MTNKEYLTKSLNGLNLTEDDIDIILVKGGLNADAEVDFTACDTAVYNRFSIVLKSALQDIKEGGYSITWNIEAVKLYYNALCNELGRENILKSKPRIRDRSNIW